MYKNPYPTVDVIIENNGKVLLIERNNEPLGWALPGGFVDYGESVESAAQREAVEETSLEVELLDLFYVYSNPSRDPRQHNLSVVFLAKSLTPLEQMKARDDARDVRFFGFNELPALCFDHARILQDYQEFRRSGNKPRPGEGR